MQKHNKLLREIFARFGVPDSIVSDNGTQFKAKVTTTPFQSRFHGKAEHFVDTFKRALGKPDGSETEDELLQQFFRVCRTTANTCTTSGLSRADLMFTKKTRSVFDKLIPNKNSKLNKNNADTIKLSHSTNTLGKGKNPIILPPAMGK